MEENKEEHGLNKSLEAIGLPKSTYYYRVNEMVSYAEKYEALKEPMHQIAEEHPDYGYPRMTPELQERGYDVGEEVVRKLMKLFGINLANRTDKPPTSEAREIIDSFGSSFNRVKDLGEINPLSVFYTDYTEIKYDNGSKKAYLMPILDHKSKFVAGYALEKRKDTDTALKAIKRAVSKLEELGKSFKDKIVHHDQDPVYTGYSWMRQVLVDLKARISYSERGAKGNTFMESFNSRFKSEARDLLLDAKNIWELKRVVKERIEYHNQDRRHSALEYLSPVTYLKREKVLPKETESLAEISA